jgi:hypothetical protein
MYHVEVSSMVLKFMALYLILVKLLYINFICIIFNAMINLNSPPNFLVVFLVLSFIEAYSNYQN